MNKYLRQATRWSVLAATAVAGMHLASAMTLDRKIQYKEIELHSPSLPGELDGYTALFLTDTHGDPLRQLPAIVERANARGVDLVLLGGDFGRRNLNDNLDTIAKIEAADGIYGVPGNHDRADSLGPAMEKRGMTLLQNQGVRLRHGLFLGGLEDLRTGNPHASAAMADAHPEDVVLLLCHNPDVAMRQNIARAELMLSGHTHGGEASLFGIWSPLMYLVSGHGQHFATGWCGTPWGTRVYVSNGVGSHSPLRVMARPQAIYLTLRGRR